MVKCVYRRRHIIIFQNIQYDKWKETSNSEGKADLSCYFDRLDYKVS